MAHREVPYMCLPTGGRISGTIARADTRVSTFRFCGADTLSGPVHCDDSGSQSLTAPAGMQRPVVFAAGCQIRPPLRCVTNGVRVSRLRVATRGVQVQAAAVHGMNSCALWRVLSATGRSVLVARLMAVSRGVRQIWRARSPTISPRICGQVRVECDSAQTANMLRASVLCSACRRHVMQ